MTEILHYFFYTIFKWREDNFKLDTLNLAIPTSIAMISIMIRNLKTKLSVLFFFSLFIIEFNNRLQFSKYITTKNF